MRREEEENHDEGDDEEDDLERSPTSSETFRRAWAAWCVAMESMKEGREAFGSESFALLALGVMLKLAQEAGNMVRGIRFLSPFNMSYRS